MTIYKFEVIILYISAKIATTIKLIAKEKNIVVKSMLKDCDLGVNTMSNLKTSMPKADTLAKIADYLDCSVDYLLGRTDILEVNRKSNAVIINIPQEKPSAILPFYITPASAGTGCYLSEDTPVEWVTVAKNKETEAADYILEVRGDSMKPSYNDGEKVLIKKSTTIYQNEIGVFIVNGESYIKKMGQGELVSLNPEYENIKLSDFDDVRCCGKVIGKVIF